MKKLLLFVAVSALGFGLAGCGEEPAPDYPSYTLHVQPILVARCVRCHNAVGTDPNTPDPDPDSPPPVIGDKVSTKEKPLTKLDTFASASGAAALIPAYLDFMPPPPSPPLTDREKEILSRWAKGKLP